MSSRAPIRHHASRQIYAANRRAGYRHNRCSDKMKATVYAFLRQREKDNRKKLAALREDFMWWFISTCTLCITGMALLLWRHACRILRAQPSGRLCSITLLCTAIPVWGAAGYYWHMMTSAVTTMNAVLQAAWAALLHALLAALVTVLLAYRQARRQER